MFNGKWQNIEKSSFQWTFRFVAKMTWNWTISRQILAIKRKISLKNNFSQFCITYQWTNYQCTDVRCCTFISKVRAEFNVEILDFFRILADDDVANQSSELYFKQFEFRAKKLNSDSWVWPFKSIKNWKYMEIYIQHLGP